MSTEKLIQDQVQFYISYIDKAKNILSEKICLTKSKTKTEKEHTINIKLSKKTKNNICKQLIKEGRFHNDLCILFNWKEYCGRVYINGSNRFGWDVSINLLENEFKLTKS